jgi:hypothetical protein
VGEWLKVNGEAVYGTNVLPVSDLWLTYDLDTVPGNRPTQQGITTPVLGATAVRGKTKGVRHSLISYLFVDLTSDPVVVLDARSYHPSSKFDVLDPGVRLSIERNDENTRLKLRSKQMTGIAVVRIASPVIYRRQPHIRR